MEEETDGPGLKLFALIVVVLGTVYLALDIWTSLRCSAYGLTSSELKVEALAVVLLIFIWVLVMLAFAFVKIRPLRFFLRLILTVAAVVMLFNHLALSREAAPLKKEFSTVAATACHLSEDGETKCGPAYDKYQKQLADFFAKKGIVRIGRWEAEALSIHGIVEMHRSAFYIAIPFADKPPADDTTFLSRR